MDSFQIQKRLEEILELTSNGSAWGDFTLLHARIKGLKDKVQIDNDKQAEDLTA